MKKNLTFTALLLALLLTACSTSAPEVTPEMNASMLAFADQYDIWYPDSDQNIARECAKNPGPVYWNEELRGYAVTCPLPWAEQSFGMVTFDESGLLMNAFGLGAASQSALSETLALLGWKR